MHASWINEMGLSYDLHDTRPHKWSGTIWLQKTFILHKDKHTPSTVLVGPAFHFNVQGQNQPKTLVRKLPSNRARARDQTLHCQGTDRQTDANSLTPRRRVERELEDPDSCFQIPQWLRFLLLNSKIRISTKGLFASVSCNAFRGSPPWSSTRRALPGKQAPQSGDERGDRQQQRRNQHCPATVSHL
jgi:hypothetical protein